MHVLITGGTGFLGQQIAQKLLEQGHHVLIVSRNAKRARRRGTLASEIVEGDLTQGPLPAQAVADVEAIVHLMGEPILRKRWHDTTKQRLRNSRILATQHLRQTPWAKLRVLVSASAVGIYGDGGDAILSESSAPAQDFLARLCQDWEHEARAFATAQIRCVCLRLGMIISQNEGALAKILPLFRLGLGGALAGGKAWMSWIHIEDACAAFIYALDDTNLTGVVNATAPQPVRNLVWTQTLAQQLHRPAFVPIPAWSLRLVLGEMSCVILASQRVVPQQLLAAGFRFTYPTLQQAFAQILPH